MARSMGLPEGQATPDAAASSDMGDRLRKRIRFGMNLADRRECGDRRGHAEGGQERYEHGTWGHPGFSFRRLIAERVGLAGGHRRDLTVQPILLVGKRVPAVSHPREAAECRITSGALRKVKTIVGVFSEDV